MSAVVVIAIIALLAWKPRTVIRIIGALVVTIMTQVAWGNIWITLFAFVVTVVPSKWGKKPN